MAPSYAERQAQYAAWRDRLRPQEEEIDLDAPATDDRWDPEALYRSSAPIDLDATAADDVLDTADAGGAPDPLA